MGCDLRVPRTESLGYSTLIEAPPYVRPMLVPLFSESLGYTTHMGVQP